MSRRSWISGGALSLWLAFPLSGVVEMFPSGGLLREGDLVTLSDDEGQVVRYTLDGSDPTSTSLIYECPLALNGVQELKARSFSAGGDPGEVVSATFAALPANLPNVLVIVADDLGYNDLGCYGAASVATPRLDRLAGAGCRFTQFTTTGPGDLASQCALLTGRLAKRAGLPDALNVSDPGLDPREWTLGEAFRKKGYDTAFVGEWHLGELAVSRPDAQGFNLFFGLPSAIENGPPLVENETTVQEMVDEFSLLELLENRAVDFLREDRAEPFFMVFQAPLIAAEGDSLFGEAGNRIEAVDSTVGGLLDALDDEGLADDTLVIFLSDEGADRRAGLTSTGSNGQLRDGGGTTWEGGVRPPMMARWPGVIPAGIDSRSLLWLPDLYQSLTNLIDGYVPEDHFLDGEDSILSLLGAETNRVDDRQLFLYRHAESGFEVATVRRGPWKMHKTIINLDPENENPTTSSSLYDVEIDPSERINLGSAERNLILQLRNEIVFHERTFTAELPQLPEEREAFLEAPEVSTSQTNEGELRAVIRFRRPADSLNEHYLIQWSEDLSSWSDEPSAEYIEEVTLEGDEEEVVLNVPLQEKDPLPEKRFMRIKSVRP